VNLLGVDGANQVVKSIDAFRELREQGQQEAPDPNVAMKHLPHVAETFLGLLTPEERAGWYPTVVETFTNAGLPIAQHLGTEWDEARRPEVEQWLQSYAPEEEPEKREAEWMLVPGDPTQERNKFTSEVRASGVRVQPPAAAGPEAPPKYVWATDAQGRRVRVREDELNQAAPGTYSDARPTFGADAAKKSQRGEAQQNVNTILGSPEGEDPDSLYSLVMRNTLPGDIGPLAAAGGVGASLQRLTRTGVNRADLELYESQKSGFIPLLARAVGHTGVLTEQDVKRTEKLLPILSSIFGRADTRVVAKRKLDRLRRIMGGEEEIPAGIFEEQEGHWPPSNVASGALSPEMEGLLGEFGYGGR
jgi:hypothetical protein